MKTITLEILKIFRVQQYVSKDNFLKDLKWA